MVACPQCRFENPDRARFCSGLRRAARAPAAPAREVRKTVTVVFCDVTGSTALGEQLDPESAAARDGALLRGDARRSIERHGGTVEKFIGDAVMAVFGVPGRARGRRAARGPGGGRDARGARWAERGARARLRHAARGPDRRQHRRGRDRHRGAARHRRRGQRRRAARAGGGAGRDPARAARRCALVRDAVDAEELEPLEAKGKAEPRRGATASCRVDGEARRAASTRRWSAAQRELRLLGDAWERVISERTCVLFTLLGAAGVGKSRLTAEFLVGRRRRASSAAAASPTARASPTGRSTRSSTSSPARRTMRAPVRSRRCSARDGRPSAGGDRARRSAGCSSGRGRAAAGRRLRRPPLGRADAPRPGRARRDDEPRRADPAPLPRPARSCSTAGRPGAAESSTRPRSCSSRSPPTRPTS